MRQPRRAALRLSLRQLQIFVAVARAGSTTAAAPHVALSQSATSAALNELEALLGGNLFDRVGRRLILNERGRSMLPEARALIEAARELEDEFIAGGRTSAPRLRLAASTTTGNHMLAKVLASYRRAHRAAQFEMRIGNTSEVVAAVANFDVDIGFIEGPTSEPHIAVLPWTRDELVIACSPRHPLARGPSGRVGLEELAQASWLLREPGSGTREAVEAMLQAHLHRLKTEVDLASTQAIMEAAAEGLGITCLSQHALRDMVRLKKLVLLKTALPRMRRTLYIIHHERRHLSPALQRFIAHCRAAYPKRR